MTRRSRRLALIAVALAVIGLAAGVALYALRDNIVFFYSPTEVVQKALPPGAEGLIVLDHFQGNRTPHTDANARSVISGLTLKHGPAHLYRAIIEGMSFGTALISRPCAPSVSPRKRS